MPVVMSNREFENHVGDALDLLPTEFTDAMSNIAILVRPYNSEEPTLLGLYHGVALTERTFDYQGFLPDTIEIYREPILAMCHSADEVRHEVAVTVLHEVGHHFGIDDEWLHANGWG
ncbi:metallopeptidase family protein [Gordonia sp. PDNC005]|uniref:metallopeptidase family protein n=1 Tax=Gordonia sp. PDNC005 TaxID=2811424 RepID=UPI00196621C6|nr:metallopeptidase family protein [Gordonia sp. PDNC005]QRY62461.1 metallopeptidase family protein [Gordonia sp. PDNC005]